MKTLISVILLSASLASVAAQVSGSTRTCGPVNGKTAQDRDNAIRFCAASVPKDLQVQGVMAMESILWVKVSRPLANLMRADRLSAEQVVKNWMGAWKSISGSKAVTVYVEWQDVKIAEGSTTLLRGDVVTIP